MQSSLPLCRAGAAVLAMAACLTSLWIGGCVSTAGRTVGTSSATQPAAKAPRSDRELFAGRFALVSRGMSAEQAQAILGPPDDIRTQRDPGGIDWANTREIWGYGTDQHL